MYRTIANNFFNFVQSCFTMYRRKVEFLHEAFPPSPELLWFTLYDKISSYQNKFMFVRWKEKKIRKKIQTGNGVGHSVTDWSRD